MNLKTSNKAPESPHLSLNEHMKPARRRRWPWVVLSLAVLVVAVCVAAGVWYFHQLEPVASSARPQVFSVREGDSAATIAGRLHDQKLIRDSLVFRLALRISGRTSSIKAGSYQLSAAESATAIIDKLESGRVDVISLQVSPGITLDAIKLQFVKAGFARGAVDNAFNKSYNHPLLRDKPASATLEGYIFPDTYQFTLDAGPEAAVTHIFDTFYDKLTTQNLITAARAKNLNIHQLITLASIIEKEVNKPDDQAHVAQIFLKRLSTSMPLGSDVTFIYAAKLLGVPAKADLVSPYNTRITVGLPPGPIANMRLQAIKAIVQPSATDDLYFVAGDDGVTYYAKTLPQHEANVAAHCKTGCQ